jgi:hypothetical protein
MTPEPIYLQLSTKRGTKFLIDIDEYPQVRQMSWYDLVGSSGIWYVVRDGSVFDEVGRRRKRHIQIGRLIKNLEDDDPRIVDHINGNARDNRRVNLRVCTPPENARNTRMRSDNTSGFKGVAEIGPNRWSASIHSCGKTHYLGVFDSPEKAYRAYCEAAVRFFGEFANFGDARHEQLLLKEEWPASLVLKLPYLPCPRKIRSDSASGFKGVRKREHRNRWEVYIKLEGKLRYLGSFDTPEEAQEAYCEAARTLCGKFVNLGEAPSSAWVALGLDEKADGQKPTNVCKQINSDVLFLLS